jgi:hypothetical protein
MPKPMTITTRNRTACLLLCLTAGSGAPALAQEYQPYPTPRITAEQYVQYAQEVKQALGSTADILQDQHLVAFTDERTRTFYIFTTKDHPAHPAWITRQIVEEGGQVRVRQIGYFAGSEAEFAKLFREYQGRNEQLMEDVQRRNQ